MTEPNTASTVLCPCGAPAADGSAFCSADCQPAPGAGLPVRSPVWHRERAATFAAVNLVRAALKR